LDHGHSEESTNTTSVLKDLVVSVVEDFHDDLNEHVVRDVVSHLK